MIFALILLINLFGCNTSSNQEAESSETLVTNEQSISPNEQIVIKDINNNTIVNLEHYGQMTQTDDSVIYTKVSNESTDPTVEMDYYRYNFESKENVKLGTIKEWVYEAFYDTIFYDNHIYMLVTTGDSYNFDETTNYLYDIDLNTNTMSAISLEKGGNPYGSMTIADDKLFIVRPGKEICYVDEYNIKTKNITEVMNYSFNSTTNTGETIRHISSNGETIYLLRLKMDTENNAQMYMDLYDCKMNFLYFIEVTDILSENMLQGEDNNELRQLVARFDVINNYIYYENFSISRAIAKIDNKDVKHFMNIDANFTKAAEPTPQNELALYYQSFGNMIYLLDTERDNGLLKESKFYADDDRYYITYITKKSKNKMLIFMNYKDPDTAETYPQKVYYVDVSELK